MKSLRIAGAILACAGALLSALPAPAAAQTSYSPYSEGAGDALARYMRLLAVTPKSFDALIGAGRAAMALGDTQAAVGFFGRAEEVDPNSPKPMCGMGAALVADGDARGALSYFARAQQLGGSVVSFGADRGLAYDLLGQTAAAQADYRAALAGPDADEARRRLSLSLAITGKKDEAISTLSPLITRRDAAAVRVRALVLALAGDSAGARTTIDTAMPGASARMDPFLRRLPTLSADQKAMAVHLGIFPGSGTNYASLTPPTYPGQPVVASDVRTNPVTGDRLSSIEELLRAPSPATAMSQPQASLPVQMASVTPPQRQQLASYSAPKIWLQLASGSNSAALPDQFRRIKQRSDDLLEGISGYVVEGPDTARLLIGPFKNESDANIFAEDLASLRIDASSWTNQPGQTIRKLPPE
jgi:Flp pilus assembly protein TadD